MSDRTLPEKPSSVGNTAEVYDWTLGWVLKLYFPRYGRGMAEYEHRIHRAVAKAGFPVPAVGMILEIDGRWGVLFERVDGISMLEDLKQHPLRLDSYSGQMADLQADMHAVPLKADLPDLRTRLQEKISQAQGLPAEVQDACQRALAQLPDGDRLCHGDFHVGNILLENGQPRIIDWIDAALGSPLADVARTTIILMGAFATLPDGFLRQGISRIHALYLERYFHLRPGGEDEYRRWLPIVAAGRMSEGIAELQPWLAEQAATVL